MAEFQNPYSSMLYLLSPPLELLDSRATAALTSACPPGVSVLEQRSQRRQGRCQSLPREVTFSAGREEKGGGNPKAERHNVPGVGGRGVTYRSTLSCCIEDTCWAPQ